MADSLHLQENSDMTNRLLTKREQAGKLLCRNRNTLTFLHAEEPADIHIQFDIQLIVTVIINVFDHRIDDHLFSNEAIIVTAAAVHQKQIRRKLRKRTYALLYRVIIGSV